MWLGQLPRLTWNSRIRLKSKDCISPRSDFDEHLNNKDPKEGDKVPKMCMQHCCSSSKLRYYFILLPDISNVNYLLFKGLTYKDF